MKFLFKVENEENLIIDNMPLVISIAYKYKPNFPDDHDDLIQIGSIGLLKAIRCFDSSLGNKLSTLATIAINREILKRISKKQIKLESIFNDDIEISSEDEYTFDDSYLSYFSDDSLYNNISEEEKRILYMRFYLNCSFAEIGKEFNKTRQWAHLKINDIIQRIRDNEKDSISNRS